MHCLYTVLIYTSNCAVKHTSRRSHNSRQTIERPESPGNFEKKQRKPSEKAHQLNMIVEQGNRSVDELLKNIQQIQKGMQPFNCMFGVEDKLVCCPRNQSPIEGLCQNSVVDGEVLRQHSFI